MSIGQYAKRERTMITGDCRPSIPRFVKLRHDAGRGRWILLAPERVFNPDEIAVSVLQRCDGVHSVSDIAAILADDYQAPADVILKDIIDMLQDLSDKGVLNAGEPTNS
ncbi:MAG: pyrroloquinoline quinone biosynthesis protein PqqD [Hyphomicrobium sp. 32-62-53]|nr:MAG: pyrroloquinoline quinone biosynthesis protein PqqD [Hyphomicrobium sp. 12-62-95]OYY00733.1 MAG: pyrroloquinoline quinone biosynthesis protein PqqD [Hyphomicrobium sp. 32-62-53]